jgi:hypothetical protein
MKKELARNVDDLSLDEVRSMGEIFCKSGFFKDARDASQAIVKILLGRELGLSPVIAMTSIHIVEGKPELSANLLASLVKQSARYDYRVRETSNTACTIDFIQDGEVVGESTFLIDDAKRARIYREGGSWTRYPKAMLFARAMSQGVRAHCPDVGTGCPMYTPGEQSGFDEPPEGDDGPPKAKATVTVKVAPLEVVGPTDTTGTNGNTSEATGRLQGTLDAAKAQADSELTETRDPESLVTASQISSFNRNFREACKAQGITDATQVDDLRHAYLKMKGFVDGGGNGTSKALPKSGWIPIRDAAVDFVGRVTEENFDKAMKALDEKAHAQS